MVKRLLLAAVVFLLYAGSAGADFFDSTPPGTGGGGTGCIPAGSANAILLDDGAGGCSAEAGPLTDGQLLVGATGSAPVGTTSPSGTYTWTGTNYFSAGLRMKRRTIASGSTDTITTADVAVFWNSASGAAKAQTIPNCTAGIDGTLFKVVDEFGDSSSNNITISPASAGTIGGGTSYKINSNYAGIDLVCDGSATNWVPN